MIFFDESHQGGKGEKVEEMLKKYVFNNTNKFPFIMVTATFANPLLRFGNEGEQFWNEKANLIQWSYEDIEFMKEINKEDGYESIIERLENQNDGESKVKEFKKILKEFEDKSITRESLASYYEKEYPELVVMCPSLELNNEQINEYNAEKNVFKEEQIDIKTLFELKTIGKKKEFKNPRTVNKLLEFISNEVYEKLLHNRFNYDVFNGKPHSQLWFLPNDVKTDSLDIDTNNTSDDFDDGFIEPVRLLAFKILEKMGKDFCVLIMHGKKDDLDKKNGQILL